MNKKDLIWYFTICLFLLLGTSCDNISKKNIDVPYVCGMNEEEKQKWIEEKIIFLEEAYQQKVISVDENNDSITFIFETEYMSPKVQFEKASYSKICDK